MNIFVAKLGAGTTGDSLRSLFEQYGEVTSAKVIMDRETGNSKRYGFVEMDDDAEGRSAISSLNETSFEGGTIVVKEARPKEGGNSRGGGDYRQGGGGGYSKQGGGGGYQKRERRY